MNVAKVGDLAEQVRGVTYRKADASGTAKNGYSPVLRAGNIGEFGLEFDDLVFVPNEKVSFDQRIRRHDVLIATSSGSLSVVGKAVQAEDDYDGGFGAFCKVLRPGPEVDPRYFGQYFRTPAYRRIVSELAAGANINNLRVGHLNDLEIPLPPLPEQKRIAAILDAADALRAKRRESLEHLDALVQSVFLDMFGDPVTNPKGWEIAPIGDVGEVTTGNTPSRKNSENYGSGIEWIKTGNIEDREFFVSEASERLSSVGEEAGRLVNAGSVLVACIAGSLASIGRAGIVDRRVAFNQQINAFTPGGSIDEWYFLGLLRTSQRLIQDVSTNSMKGMVSKSTFMNIRIPLPPYSLQGRFRDSMRAIADQRVLVQSHLTELDTLFASLQSRAFRGEL